MTTKTINQTILVFCGFLLIAISACQEKKAEIPSQNINYGFYKIMGNSPIVNHSVLILKLKKRIIALTECECEKQNDTLQISISRIPAFSNDVVNIKFRVDKKTASITENIAITNIKHISDVIAFNSNIEINNFELTLSDSIMFRGAEITGYLTSSSDSLKIDGIFRCQIR